MIVNQHDHKMSRWSRVGVKKFTCKLKCRGIWWGVKLGKLATLGVRLQKYFKMSFYHCTIVPIMSNFQLPKIYEGDMALLNYDTNGDTSQKHFSACKKACHMQLDAKVLTGPLYSLFPKNDVVRDVSPYRHSEKDKDRNENELLIK